MGVVSKLAEHLGERYGVAVSALTPLEPWAPEGAQRVGRADGSAWVARVFPPERAFAHVEGDADLLRFLASHDYPAERLADDEPVSMLDGHAVLVTGLLPGKNGRGETSPSWLEKTGELVGLLNTLPTDNPATARPAGGWHHLSINGGGRRTDVALLQPMMDEAAKRLTSGELEAYKELQAALDGIDGCEDLPHALINSDLCGPNLMLGPDGEATTIDWTGAGRGPRVHSLTGMNMPTPELVEAFVRGYRRHVELTTDELGRLAGALDVHFLVLRCWSFAKGYVTVEKALVEHRGGLRDAEMVALTARKAFAASKL
jgi:Ser/Thr protein kinase RdoA (MazF antagonist)